MNPIESMTRYAQRQALDDEIAHKLYEASLAMLRCIRGMPPLTQIEAERALEGAVYAYEKNLGMKPSDLEWT